METALYDAEHGFYAKNATRPTREGDFLTSPEISPLFGRTVAYWVAAATRHLATNECTLVEVGAGRGTLAGHVLQSLVDEHGLKVGAHLVERGTAPREALEERFQSNANVSVHADVSTLPAKIPVGVFLANELFDNIPFKRVMMTTRLQEIHVRFVRGRFEEELVDADAALQESYAKSGLQLAEGQTSEVRTQDVALLEDVLGRFDRGAMLVFDYGGTAQEVSGEAAPHGTARAYRGHQSHTDLYADPGDQDITADVNVTPLFALAQGLGFKPATLESQARFLVRNGLPERVVERVQAEKDPFQQLKINQLAKQLYHPEAMGESFFALHAIKRQ